MLGDADTGTLHRAGLWGMAVRVLQDQPRGGGISAGACGQIGTVYPVGLSCFDLLQEAPLMGLTTALGTSDAVLGVPWAHLCTIRGNGARA